jgi:hypothetical protein
VEKILYSDVALKNVEKIQNKACNAIHGFNAFTAAFHC